ncbi:MAG: general secretion pathway protein [Winogradskyella sp.]
MNSKQKNIVLIVGFITVLYICYILAVSKTLEQKELYNNLSKEVILSKNAPKQLSLLKQKEVYYDSLLTKYQLDGSSIQNNLLKVINSYAESNNLKVVSFLEPHVIAQNDLTIKTYDFTVEGNYNDIIKLIYQLEQQTKFGEIVNIHFEKKKNFRTGRYYLRARVLLKSFG